MGQQIVSKEIFGKRFSEVLAASTETTYSIADRLSLSPGTISRYTNGKMAPKISTLYMLADALGVNPLWLMGYDEPKHVKQESKNILPEGAYSYKPTHRIPILGRIVAGMPIYAEENIEGYTYTDLNGGAEYFALRVVGDSMDLARIYEGDTLIVRRQDVVEPGEIAVVMVGEDEATVKRFYQTDTVVTLIPESTNPKHKPQVYDLREVPIRILGKVVKVEFMIS